MTFPQSTRTDRVLLFTTFSALALCLVIQPRLEAASSPARRSDAELSRALIGTWEIKGKEEDLPIKKIFTTFDTEGRFTSVGIIEFSGIARRREVEGKWHVKNGYLIERVTRSSPRAAVGQATKVLIVSIENDMLVWRSEDGGQIQARRGRMPAQFPPLLSLDWMDKLIVAKPIPAYPIEARRLRLEGKGRFILTINGNTGAVTAISVATSTGHKILDEAAVNALKKWRFKLGTFGKAGVPVKFTMRRTVEGEPIFYRE